MKKMKLVNKKKNESKNSAKDKYRFTFQATLKRAKS